MRVTAQAKLYHIVSLLFWGMSSDKK